MILLHDLVGDPTDLAAEGADQVVRDGEHVDVLDHSSQGAVGVPGTHGCAFRHILVSKELNVRILLPALA